MRSLSLGVLLFANYFFYAKWDIFYLALIPAASTCDYLFGLGLQYSKNVLVRRILVGLSVFGLTMQLMSQHIANYLHRLPEDMLQVAQFLGAR